VSFQITDAFTQQYKNNVILQFQQKGSKLRGTMRERELVGKNDFWERIGATAAIKRTTRHGDMPQIDTPHSRRMVTLTDYEWNDLIDKPDRIRLLIEPENEYAINGGNALGRAFDDEVITAFDGDAKAGETGSTTVTFAADWPVTRSGTEGDPDFSAAALTTANILTLQKMLDNRDVPADGRYVAISPAGLSQLLGQSTSPNAASSDYNSIKALVDGSLNTWVGFTWIKTTRLKVAAGTDIFCFAWHRDSMAVSVGQEIMTDIAQRKDKSGLPTQVYLCGSYGATRVQGEGIVRFRIDDAL
jgi:hypothetical protein